MSTHSRKRKENGNSVAVKLTQEAWEILNVYKTEYELKSYSAAIKLMEKIIKAKRSGD